MVFLKKELLHTLIIHPRYLGAQLLNTLRQQLVEEVEGKNVQGGYVIKVLKFEDEDVKEGVIQSLTGSVEFVVRYRAIFLRPFKNEVMDASVTTITPVGFYAEVGPLQVFVSHHHIPEEFKLHNDSTSFVSDSGGAIKKGTAVRLQIVSASVQAAHISAVGTISEPYLGIIRS